MAMESSTEVNHSPRKVIKRLIRRDDQDEFLRYMREQLQEGDTKGKGNSFCAAELLKLICVYRAVGCATVLVEGEIRMAVDLNAALEGGLPPLHLASQSLCYDLTKLFLMYGAQPNQGLEDDNAKLPLCLALEALCNNQYVSDWSIEKSVFKIFYIFCLRELKEPLDTVKLLASRTEQLENISLRCVVEGNVVQLTALLLLSWNKLVLPYSELGIEGSPVGKRILEELQSLSNEKTNLISERKIQLESAWKMFKILETHRDDIEEYRKLVAEQRTGQGVYEEGIEKHEVPFDVLSWVKFKSIPLKPEDVYSDDVKCLMPRLRPKQKAWLYRALEKRMNLGPTRVHTEFDSERLPFTRSLHTCRDFNQSVDVKLQVTQKYLGSLPSRRLTPLLMSTTKRILQLLAK